MKVKRKIKINRNSGWNFVFGYTGKRDALIGVNVGCVGHYQQSYLESDKFNVDSEQEFTIY